MNAAALLPAVFRHVRARSATQPVTPYGTAYRLERFDPQDIRRYNAMLGFPRDDLPVTYYYLVAQRAHLATLLDARFPFTVVGMVHVENDLIEHARPALDSALDIVTTVSVPAPGESGARHCLLETVATHRGDRIFTCRSTYLVKRGQRKPSPSHHRDVNRYPLLDTWALTAATGREYAAVSGDWNPIHLWTWSARLMGMRSPIIHGMHTVAKTCALLQARAGRRISAVSARFKAPISLGGQVHVAAPPDYAEFMVLHDGRIAVQGTLSFMSNQSQEGSV